MPRVLMFLGLVLFAVGLLWSYGSRFNESEISEKSTRSSLDHDSAKEVGPEETQHRSLWSMIWGKLGHLPGDIEIRREGFHFYFPIVTCLLFSGILMGLGYLWLWFFKR